MQEHPLKWPAALLGLYAAAAAGSDDPAGFDAGRDNQAGLTFSPDGKTAFWAEWDGDWGSSESQPRSIFISRRQPGGWSEPEPAPFSGPYSDDDPFVSPDGRWLYFASERPPADGEADIWRYSLAGDDRLERLAISSDAAEYSPIVVNSGALYFASAREGGPGRGDIYRADARGDGFAAPEPLGPAINSATGEWNLWVSGNETELIFEASSRPTNVSTPGDLYYSRNTPAGWTAAVPIEALNTARSDLMPRFDAAGEALYVTTVPDGRHARVRQVDWAPLRAELTSSYAPTLAVVNRSSHEVTFVDLGNAEIVARVATGEGPHLVSNLDSGRLAVTGYGEFPKPHAEPVAARPPFVTAINSRLTLIDTTERSALMDVAIDDCRKPHASWIVDGRAYVTCEGEREVVAVDLESGQVLRRYASRQDGSHVLRFDASSRVLAVANTGSGSVTLIDVDDGDTSVVPVDTGSEGLALVDGRFWVGNAIAGSVAVIDPRERRVVGQADEVCGFPIALDGRQADVVWIACFASAELVAIDKDTMSVARRIPLDANPLHMIVHPERDLAYASLPRANAIAEIDLLSGRELRRIRVGIEPDGLQWAGRP